VRETRKALRNGLVEVLHDLFELLEGSNETHYEHFINADKKSLLSFVKQEEAAVAAADVEEDFTDTAASIHIPAPPPGMYQ
jgi:hypothetical protein